MKHNDDVSMLQCWCLGGGGWVKHENSVWNIANFSE